MILSNYFSYFNYFVSFNFRILLITYLICFGAMNIFPPGLSYRLGTTPFGYISLKAKVFVLNLKYSSMAFLLFLRLIFFYFGEFLCLVFNQPIFLLASILLPSNTFSFFLLIKYFLFYNFNENKLGFKKLTTLNYQDLFASLNTTT